MNNEAAVLKMGAKEEGKGLKHMPSYDKLWHDYVNEELDTQEQISNAASTIQSWVKKLSKMKAIKETLIGASESCSSVLGVVTSMSSMPNMTAAREALSHADFVNNLSNLLLLLPRDPSLKARNKIARSVRTVTFALLIASFPNEVFEHDSRSDFSSDEENCEVASKMVVVSFRRLCQSIIANQPLVHFRWAFLGYRHSMRHFLDTLDTWRRCDSERVRAQLEMSYMEAYAMYVASQLALEEQERALARLRDLDDDSRVVAQRDELQRQRGNTENVIRTAQTHITRFKQLLSQQQSEEGLQNRLEELEAHIRASLRIFPVDSSDMTAPAPIPSEEKQIVSTLVANYTPDIILESYAKELNHLQRIAQLTGYTLMHLVHELAVNPSFQIPIESTEDTPQSQDDQTVFTMSLRAADTDAAAKALKRHLIRVMKDRMISLLTRSSFSEAKVLVIIAPLTHYVQDLVLGRAYPIDFGIKQGNHITELKLEQDSVTVQYIIDNKSETIPLSRIKRAQDGVDPSLFLSSLSDIREQIGMIIPGRQDVHQVLSTAIDAPLLTQMIKQDALHASDVLRIFIHIVETLLSLQSPVRAEQTLSWFRHYQTLCSSCASLQEMVPYIPDFFETISLRLEELKIEMANVYLAMLFSFAQSHGSALLRHFFFQQLSSGHITSLPNVVLFVTKDVCATLTELDSSLTTLREFGLTYEASQAGHVRDCDYALLSLSLSKLISAPFDFGAPQNATFLPMTFVYDGTRLRNIRNDIDGLALMSTLVISVRQTILGLRIPLTSKNELDLQILLTKALRNKAINFIYLVDEVKSFVYSVWDHRQVVDDAPRPALPEHWEGTLVQAMQRCVTKDNAVLELFTKRVHKAMILGLLNRPYEEKLAGWSMNSKTQAHLMRDIINKAKELYTFHIKTYGDLYRTVIRTHLMSLRED